MIEENFFLITLYDINFYEDKMIKKIKYIIIPILLCLTFNSYAQEKFMSSDIEVSVKGLVCDFCAQSISKLFSKEKSVKAIDVNLDQWMIKIDLKDGYKMDDTKITKLITDSGYNVERINRIE